MKTTACRFLERALLALPWLLAANMLHALPFEKQFLRVTDHGTPMRGGLAVADFSGDGIDEVFLASDNQIPLLIAYEQASTELRVARYFPLPLSEQRPTELHVWRGAGGPRLIAVSPNGALATSSTVQIYAGWPLSLVQSYEIPPGHRGSAVGDLDGDGQPELVALVANQTRAFRLADGTQLWSLPNSAVDIALANLDGDPALEILLAGTTGLAFDGVTRAQEWAYPAGFGNFLAAGNIGPGGTPGFVGARASGLFSVFRGVPWSQVWDYEVFNLDAVASANLDGVGADEILQGDGSWGMVNVFDSQTQSLRYSVPNPGFGIAAVAGIRTATSQGMDIVFSPGSFGTSRGRGLQIVRPSDGLVVYSVSSDAGGIGATSIGDLDANGVVDLVVASSATEPTRIRILDRASGAVAWQSPEDPGGVDDPFYLSPRFLFQTQLDDDPAMELVVAGRSLSAGRIIVLDGLTHAVQLQIGDYSSSRPLDSREIVGAALVDYDGDGFQDIALETQATTTGENGVRVHVFSLRTGLALWESVRMGAGFAAARGLMVMPGNGQTLLVAAVPDGLRAFGVQSQLLEWTYTAQIQKAVYHPAAPGGAEIVLEDDDGTVTHLDAATRSERRSYQLNALSRAIVAVPNAPFLLVAEAGVLTLRKLDGSVLGVAPDTLANVSRAPISIAASGAQFDVLTGMPMGVILHTLNPEGVFADAFEGD